MEPWRIFSWSLTFKVYFILEGGWGHRALFSSVQKWRWIKIVDKTSFEDNLPVKECNAPPGVITVFYNYWIKMVKMHHCVVVAHCCWCSRSVKVLPPSSYWWFLLFISPHSSFFTIKQGHFFILSFCIL